MNPSPQPKARSPDDPIVRAFVLEGLRLRQVDPLALGEHVRQVLAAPPADAWLTGHAHAFNAWRCLALGDKAGTDRALAQARGALAPLADGQAEILCAGLRADVAARDGRWEDVLRIGEATLALPQGQVPDWERYRAGSRRTVALERLGRLDDALRASYQNLAFARSTDEPALLANALGSLGGMQSSLMNLVDAEALCDEAWGVCAQTDWHAVVQLAGTNRLAVMSGLGRHAEAAAMFDALWQREAFFPRRYRGMRLCLYAMALSRGDRLDDAQSLLDLASAESRRDAENQLGWAWIQAGIHNRRGHAAEALACVQPWLSRRDTPIWRAGLPVDRAQLLGQAALSHEALGQLMEALACEREAAATRELATAQAAHARRLTLQIEHELDTARRERDHAQREQQRLSALNGELAAADAAKTRFLAAASHDLRQPVQALTMYLAALQAEPSAVARRDLLERIERALQALGSLFDGLLDVSRLDAGLIPVQRLPVALDTLLGRLADDARAAADAKQLVLRLRVDSGHAWGVSDAVLLERCLRNLIDNAIKYTERGGVVLRLRAHAAVWRIEVCDTGIGIEPALHRRVFDEFFQVGNEERDRRQGLGLGLAIVKRMAQLLEHPLSLHSRPGRGSRFSLSVPRAAAPVAEPRPKGEPEEASAALHLLVLDDDAAVRDSLRALLTRWGHRVWCAEDDAVAIRAWRASGAPPLHGMVADLRLRGGGSGLDAIARVRRAVAASLPALVITGDTAPDRLRQLAVAEQVWLAKPVQPLRLRSWLAQIHVQPLR